MTETGQEVLHPSRSSAPGEPRVAIVADHASLQFGGEAALPFHFFRVLRKRGVAAWLIVHERCRNAVLDAFPAEATRVVFVRDRWLHRTLYRTGRLLPARVAVVTTGLLLTLVTQVQLRRALRGLIRREGVQVVHQPIPVSPKAPSLIGGLGVPVVMGPMNGGMDFPPAFRSHDGMATRVFVACARFASHLVHRVVRGKLSAEVLLVANQRTARALPRGARGEVIELVENGVDLEVWQPPADPPSGTGGGVVRFVFLGRLVDWKAVDLLLEAFARSSSRIDAELLIVGDGPMRPALERLAVDLGLVTGARSRVEFTGWAPQAECSRRLAAADVLVLPSLYECGGAVVLEAMALGKPVIATGWGGPADYLDQDTGILVPPTSREAFVEGLADAMILLAGDPERRRRLGASGREKVLELYSWDRKADAILAVYHRAIAMAEA